jgi:signal transduction histidine kinase
MLRFDKDRMSQVLSNILGNALKFTPHGGKVGVRVEKNSYETVISVEDSGPGIPSDQIAHIFDRYWQARNTARQGNGLGLSIAKSIVEAHEGKLTVKSTFGKGTTFFISLPNQPMKPLQLGSPTAH